MLLAQIADTPWLEALAGSGPWAIMAGYLLVRILAAWQEDRNRLDAVVPAIQRVAEALDRLERRLDDHERAKSTP